MIRHTPHIVVSKDAGYENTNLYEFWVLGSQYWNIDLEDGMETKVKLYIAPFNGTTNVTKSGLPPKSEAVVTQCDWEDVPAGVREEIRNEVEDMKNLLESIQ